MIIYRNGEEMRGARESTTLRGIEYTAFVGKYGKLRKFKTIEALDEAMNKIGFKRSTAGRVSSGEK